LKRLPPLRVGFSVRCLRRPAYAGPTVRGVSFWCRHRVAGVFRCERPVFGIAPRVVRRVGITVEVDKRREIGRVLLAQKGHLGSGHRMAHDDWLHNMKRLDDTPDIFGQLGYGIAAFRQLGCHGLKKRQWMYTKSHREDQDGNPRSRVDLCIGSRTFSPPQAYFASSTRKFHPAGL